MFVSQSRHLYHYNYSVLLFFSDASKLEDRSHSPAAGRKCRLRGIASSWISKEFRVAPKKEILPLERSPSRLTKLAG